MKADDPRLVQSLERLTNRIAEYDEQIVNVLKNHLAVNKRGSVALTQIR